MISIIICSVNEALLAQLKKNIAETIGVEYEVIAIDNSHGTYSISQAYNLAAVRAKYPYLCFIHEDILFHTNNWGRAVTDHLHNKDISLIGVLGCLIKTQTPSGVYIPVQQLNRVNQLQRRRDSGTDHYYQNPLDEKYSEVTTLDGMFLAITRANHLKYLFDEDLLKGFHAYDVDYSLGQAKTGKVAVIYNILIEHFSHGGNTRGWIDAQLLLTKKWENQLPQHIMLNDKEIKEAEIVNIETFLIALYSTRYKKHLQLLYLSRLLLMRPLSLKNFYFIRKFLINEAVESAIKKMMGRK